MLIVKQHRIYRQDLVNNRHLIYVFGDNLERKGLGGQAKEVRGEKNAHGIATKRKMAHGTPDCYFHDNEADAFVSIVEDFRMLHRRLQVGQYLGVVLPSDGIGTGLAELTTRAPKLLDLIYDLMEQIR